MFRDFRRTGWRKLVHGYHVRNWIERRKNSRLLKNARNSNPQGNGSDEPLVSVVIATYNLGKVLAERTIPSILRQTYSNLEVVVVGDQCTDNTEKLIGAINDERIKFHNLPQRGQYPENPSNRWRVAGVVPRNRGLELCRGEWIATSDDDDEFTDNHIEILLNHARENDCEMVYGKVRMEVKPGEWREVGAYPLKPGHISHMAALYHSKLKFLKYDIKSWRYAEPADWNFWRRMKEAGTRIGFVDSVVGTHYLEGTRRSA
jgi:glycosyltransferase involved in cell wall biosynthesis